jgi:hypothetical protein
MNTNALKSKGFTDNEFIIKYMEKHKEALCNLVDNENLRVLFHIETMYTSISRWNAVPGYYRL